jgi:hypothetical protein
MPNQDAISDLLDGLTGNWENGNRVAVVQELLEFLRADGGSMALQTFAFFSARMAEKGELGTFCSIIASVR